MTHTDTDPRARRPGTPERFSRAGRDESTRWPVPLPARLAVAPLLRWFAVSYAVPQGEPDRRDCLRCGTPIGRSGSMRALTPAGRCGGCGTRLGAPPYAIELALIVALGLLLIWGRPPVESLALAWWAGCAIPLAFIDVAVHRLPDRLTYPAAVGTAVLLGLAALTGETGLPGGTDGGGTAWLRALAAAVGLAAAFATCTLLLGRRGFGLGDAKLALSSVAILGWLGWSWVLSGLLVAFAGSALTALALLVTRRISWSGQLPFGPFLILGTTVALALAS